MKLLLSRFLNSKPQTPSPKPNSLSGPEDQESPQAKQPSSSPFDWSSFLCAAMKEERLKTDSSCLAMTEAEQAELYETIRHALHALRKHKVFMGSSHVDKFYVCPRLCKTNTGITQSPNVTFLRVPFRNNVKRLQQ